MDVVDLWLQPPSVNWSGDPGRLKQLLIPEERRPARALSVSKSSRTLSLLHKAGVPLVLGTDAGVSGTYHGWATVREWSDGQCRNRR